MIWPLQARAVPASGVPAEQPPLPVRHTSSPVIGYRAWYLVHEDAPGGEWVIPVDPEDAVLRSLVMTFKWAGPVVRADGPPADRQPTTWAKWSREFGYHGLYAWRSKNAPPLWGGYSTHCDGTVHLFGRVVVHEDGYRAECARVAEIRLNPTSLAWMGWPWQLNDDPKPWVRALSRRYDCEVIPWR